MIADITLREFIAGLFLAGGAFFSAGFCYWYAAPARFLLPAACFRQQRDAGGHAVVHGSGHL